MLRPLLLLIVVACASVSPIAVRAAENDAGWIAYNKDLLKKRLRHPELAEFRGLYLSRKGGVPALCGELNARNSDGSESGFQRFLGAGSMGVFFPDEVDDFEALWRTFCR